jgi:hypothetical protein
MATPSAPSIEVRPFPRTYLEFRGSVHVQVQEDGSRVLIVNDTTVTDLFIDALGLGTNGRAEGVVTIGMWPWTSQPIVADMSFGKTYRERGEDPAAAVK